MKILKFIPLEIKRIEEIKLYQEKIFLNSTEKILLLDNKLVVLEENVDGSESFIAGRNYEFKAIGNVLYKEGQRVLETKEDINQIDLNCYGNLVGITDDSGTATTYNLKSGQILVSKTKHQNIAVPISFRPTLGRQFCTGGFDCCVILWDAERLTEKLRIEFKPRPAQPGCNPPHVHSLSWSKDGSTLYAGLGSGDLAVMAIPRVLKSIKDIPITYLSGHAWSISSIVCISNSVVITGSIDKHVILWKDGVAISRLNMNVKINTMALYSNSQILVGSTDSILRVVDVSEDI